jgi:hypothetical protein
VNTWKSERWGYAPTSENFRVGESIRSEQTPVRLLVNVGIKNEIAAASRSGAIG